MSNKNPHTAIVMIQIEVHPNLPTGECSGHPLTALELKELGIESTQVVHVKGFDRFDLIKKLKEKLAELKT